MPPRAVKPENPSTAMWAWPTTQFEKCVTSCTAGSDWMGPWMHVTRYQSEPTKTNRPRRGRSTAGPCGRAASATG